MTMNAIRIENATLISTTSGMPLAPVARQHQPVLERHETHDLAYGIATGHHDQKPEQHDRQREGEILARQWIGLRGHSQHQNHGERDQAHPGQHGGADTHCRFDVAVDPELLDDAVQRHRDDDCLEDEGDCRGHVKVRRVLDEGLPGDGKREYQGVQCKDVRSE